MKDIFHDPEFEKMLYGGVHDLDEPVGKLVYNLWKSGIQTTRSCSGHIGRFLDDAGNAYDNLFVYLPGHLDCNITPRAGMLTQKLGQVCQ